MTYKQIETSREIRLWIGQIVVPAVTTAVMMMTVPEVRDAVKTKVKKVKKAIGHKLIND